MLSFPNAKINIGLHITSKRPDGYHNLETVFYPVKIQDALEITDANTASCKVFGLELPENGRDNICLKAFELINKDFDLTPQAIHLLKNIPVGAGLGGGSADGAFMIKMLNTRFGLGLSISQMEDYARILGADCAFFIKNKPVYAIEKGDIFHTIKLELDNYKIHLINPAIHVSTQDAFSNVSPKQPTLSLEELINTPIEGWKNLIKNDFEPSVFSKYPQIEALKNDLYAQGAIFAQMSGSGSSVYGIFKEEVTLKMPVNYKVYYNIQ